MKAKRFRAPKAKPGELLVRYGKLPNDSPDVVIAWGDGASKRDGAFLYYRLACGRPALLPGGKPEISLIEDLEARGYDITTLRFSIMKKQSGVSQ